MATNDSNRLQAWDYLRKSTKGMVEKNGKKAERQEDSIERQREALDKLGVPQSIQQAGYTDFQIVGTFSDPGVSGTKIDDRPGLQALLASLKGHPSKVKALRLDTMTRLSRASLDETTELIRRLKDMGVRWIVTAVGTIYDLGPDNDFATYITLASAVWLACEESRMKSWNVSNGMKLKADKGQRLGGRAPYGLRRDPEHGLVPGDDQKIETVCQIFRWFADEAKSLHWIAMQLNAQKVPGPRGGLWHQETVKGIVRQRAYVGALAFGTVSRGRFHQLGSDGELKRIQTADFVPVMTASGKVVKRPPRTKNAKPAVLKPDVFEAIVEKRLFDKAQRRFASFKTGAKPRANGYALSRILVCAHCGSFLTGTEDKKGHRVYRCPNGLRPRGKQCRRYSEREDRLLPAIMTILDQEIDQLTAASLAPVMPTTPYKQPVDHSDRIEELTAEIADAENAFLRAKDARLFKSLEERINAKRDELERLEAEQAAPVGDGVDSEAVAGLKSWWREVWEKHRHQLPPSGKIAKAIDEFAPYYAAWGDKTIPIPIDPRVLNETLHSLGTQVRLWWKVLPRAQRDRFELQKGRLTLGTREADITGKYQVQF